MSALCLILNSAYYANHYAGIFDAGLTINMHNNYTSIIIRLTLTLFILLTSALAANNTLTTSL